jgi:hypothetical protein
MRAAVGLSTDFLSAIESLASASEVREVGALHDDRSGDGRMRREKIRAVAQLGRALRSGRRGRGFKSHQPDVLHHGGAWFIQSTDGNGYRNGGEVIPGFLKTDQKTALYLSA